MWYTVPFLHSSIQHAIINLVDQILLYVQLPKYCIMLLNVRAESVLYFNIQYNVLHPVFWCLQPETIQMT